MEKNRKRKVLALSGGVGGAKLALGLSQVLAAEELTVVVNTGDDFRHLGLAISPDIDTLLYTLSNLADPERGWGRRDETWTFMKALAQLGGDAWFLLGDGDLALHVERTQRLARGETLSQITASLRRELGIAARLLPMTDDSVHTRVKSDEGWLAFQDYFVRRRCEPAVREIDYAGANDARPHADALALLADPDLRAVIVCPSNPWLSVGPLLAMPALREALRTCAAPVIAVSPLIGGEAVKGPTAKLMRELNLESTTAEVARYYDGLVDGIVIDPVDAGSTLPRGMHHVVEPIMMKTLDDRIRVAHTCLEFADRVRTA